MKGKIIYLLLILAACGSQGVDIPPEYSCSKNARGFLGITDINACYSSEFLYKEERSCDTKLAAKFIIDCAKAANPMSDEEGEDLVVQCEKTSVNLFCKTTIVYKK